MSHERGHINEADYAMQGYSPGDLPLDPPTPIVGGEGGSLAIDKNLVAFTAAKQVAVDSRAQGRAYELVEIDNPNIPGTKVWAYQFTTPYHKPPTTKEEAQALIDQLNEDFPSDTHHWVLRDVDEATGIYDIGSRKKEASDTQLDPENLVLTRTIPGSLTEDGWPREEWATVDLPDGSKIGFLTDGRTFNIPADKEEDWFKNFDASDVKEETIGGEDWLIWPDGSRTRVTPEEDKFTGGIDPEDVTDVTTIALKDGTDVVILNNGQMIRTGKDVVPAKVTYKGSEMAGVPGKFQVTQPDGSIGFVEPVYEQGFLEGTGDYNLFQQRSGNVTDLGLPQVPAQIETLTGAGGAQQQFIRGTQGELLPLNDVLDRAIEQAVINGDIDKAIAFDDFRKRPSRAEALQMALQYARSPADQYLISALHAGEEYIVPPVAGELQRVGQPAQFLQDAYQEFRDTLTGGRLPTSEEFQQAVAPPGPTELELAKLDAVNLQNELTRVKIENERQKGADAHSLAYNKMGNDSKITEEKISSSQSKVNRDNNYSDWQMNGGASSSSSTVAETPPASEATGEVTPTGVGDWQPQEGTTPMVNNEGEVKNIANEYVDLFGSPDNLAGWEVISEEDIKEAQDYEAEQEEKLRVERETERLAVEQQRVDDAAVQAAKFQAALDAGFNPADPGYHNIASRAIEAYEESVAARNREELMDAIYATGADTGKESDTDMPPSPVGTDLMGELQEGTGREEPGFYPPTTLRGYPSGTTFRDLERYYEEQGLIEARAGGGTVQPGEITMVGESGPELALFPNGTEIIPLDRNVQPAQARRLRRRGIRGMENGGQIGGTVFSGVDDVTNVGDIDLSRYGGELPSGIRRTVAGQSVAPSAGRLFRAAGLTQPSGQAIRNMLPEELAIYKDIGAQTGIPEGTFERELALGIPSGERRRGSARFLPLSLRS